ncbi:lysozyme [Dyella sp. KRB-257]|uniref:lysozyme n=1 Tax=Dyella sp. KRB-257 TaxID=3400915 RepID=UPI003BFD7890
MKRWQKLALSGAGAAAIAAGMSMDWEGTVHRAYFDRVGHAWTICTGHTRGVKPGDTATDAECQAYLQQDQAEARAAVDRCIHADLTETQRAAFIDAAFNLGPGVVCDSTLQHLANSGDVTGACLQLTDALDRRGNRTGWAYAGGQFVQGLHNRRVDERNACLGYFR